MKDAVTSLWRRYNHRWCVYSHLPVTSRTKDDCFTTVHVCVCVCVCARAYMCTSTVVLCAWWSPWHGDVLHAVMLSSVYSHRTTSAHSTSLVRQVAPFSATLVLRKRRNGGTDVTGALLLTTFWGEHIVTEDVITGNITRGSQKAALGDFSFAVSRAEWEVVGIWLHFARVQ